MKISAQKHIQIKIVGQYASNRVKAHMIEDLGVISRMKLEIVDPIACDRALHRRFANKRVLPRRNSILIEYEPITSQIIVDLQRRKAHHKSFLLEEKTIF